MIETKTKAYIVRTRTQGKRPIPCFINGRLPRPSKVRKIFVYYFNSEGDLIVTIIPTRFVQEAEFRLV